MKRIVVVEDRQTTRWMVEETLRRRGYAVAGCGTLAEGRELLAAEPPDLLLTDLQLPDGTGLDLLREALARDPRLPALVMSAYGTIEIAVEAIKLGAYDFVTKPFDTSRLASLIAHALERRPRASDAKGATEPLAETAGIVTASPAMGAVVAAARKVAPSDATALILGESGTGKELVARAIDRWSGRAQGPLLCVNCAALPRELVESEFFGSERGAFTGATARKLGTVELAAAGTLFLDEIAELPGDLQAKFLRVLQERTFMRVGGTEELHADIRVIAATNQALDALVREGRFREDLYYRVNVFPIRVPALRERSEDVLPLAEEFLRRAAAKHGRGRLALTNAARSTLESSPWPGNVRQLENAIERAVILSEGAEILPEHLVDVPGAEPDRHAAPALPVGATLLDVGRQAQRRAESEAIRRALAETGGNKTEAARLLGVSYKTLWSKLKEYERE